MEKKIQELPSWIYYTTESGFITRQEVKACMPTEIPYKTVFCNVWSCNNFYDILLDSENRAQTMTGDFLWSCSALYRSLTVHWW